MSDGVRHALARLRAARRRRVKEAQPDRRAWSGGLPADLYLAYPQPTDDGRHLARRGSA